jgi:hypothetical protein
VTGEDTEGFDKEVIVAEAGRLQRPLGTHLTPALSPRLGGRRGGRCHLAV